jgi:hypothetical protein
MLLEALFELSEHGNCQIILTTKHQPVIIIWDEIETFTYEELKVKY